MKNNKKIITYSIIGILVMILSVAGVAYAWFSTNISGDGAEIIVTTATIGPLTYTGTEITAEGVLPGWISEDAELKVEGIVTTEDAVGYTCYIENTGEITDVEYRISGDGYSTSEEAEWRNINDSILVSGFISSGNSVDEYKLAVRFKETGLDQNDQQGKTLSVNVTCEVVDASVDANIVAWTLDGETQTGEIPKKASGYLIESVSCTNDAIGVWNEKEWGLDVRNITKTPANCTVNFIEGKYLYTRILADNPNKETRETFDTIYTASNNGNTIHYADGQNDETSYYFAGNVTNNYVLFANRYWRIVRINEDGSVRLLHYGTDINGTNMFPATKQKFSTSGNNSSVYAGYKYTSGVQHGTETNSEMKTYLEGWYTSNLSSYDTYISRTAIYCNDRTVIDGTWTERGATAFNYAALTRLVTNPSPTFVCANVADRFTGSESTGNGELGEKPIGLITIDELSYAGGHIEIMLYPENTSYYIGQNVTGAEYWWTMSPYRWRGSTGGYNIDVFSVGGSTSTGGLTAAPASFEYGVRPVISLKACTTWSKGNGTSASPYEVTIDSECAASEN